MNVFTPRFRRMARRRLRAWAAALLLAFFCAPASQALTMADLLVPGATLDSGSLRFADFVYVPSTPNQPVAAAVTVSPIVDGSGHHGVRIEGLFGDDSGTLGPSGAGIAFSVSVLDPLLLIDGAFLEGNPSVTAIGEIKVSESIDSLPSESLEIFADSLSGGPVFSQTSDSAPVSPRASLGVVIDGVIGYAATGEAVLTRFDQTFSVIPEPSTALLVALGLSTLAVARRKN